MANPNDNQLLAFNHQGLIPGPRETVEDFSKRADYCLELKDHLSAELKANLRADIDESPEVLDLLNNCLCSLYDVAPSWIPVFFSNYKLMPWHGGCAWIFQITEESPTAAIVQLRQAFRNSTKYLGIYDREELLSHELIHVGRMTFQEPKFEEIFTYQTSKSAFRRWLGPIIQSSIESVTFILIIAMILVFDIFLITSNNPEAYRTALWLKLIPIGLIVFGLVRLAWKYRIYQKCLDNLEKCVGTAKNARAVAYRLTDDEITAFSKMSTKEISDYAAAHEQKELRWRVIYLAYFEKKVEGRRQNAE